MKKQMVAMLSQETGNNEDWNVNYCNFVLIEGEESELKDFQNMAIVKVPDTEDCDEQAIKMLQSWYPNVKFTFIGKAGLIELRLK